MATVRTESETPSPSRARRTTAGGGQETERLFTRSIVISGLRCTLTYVLLPFVAPLIGLAPGVGPVLGIAIGAVALVANVFSIRRFWASQHRWRIPATIIHTGVIILLLILMFFDIRTLVGG